MLYSNMTHFVQQHDTTYVHTSGFQHFVITHFLIPLLQPCTAASKQSG